MGLEPSATITGEKEGRACVWRWKYLNGLNGGKKRTFSSENFYFLNKICRNVII